MHKFPTMPHIQPNTLILNLIGLVCKNIFIIFNLFGLIFSGIYYSFLSNDGPKWVCALVECTQCTMYTMQQWVGGTVHGTGLHTMARSGFGANGARRSCIVWAAEGESVSPRAPGDNSLAGTIHLMECYTFRNKLAGVIHLKEYTCSTSTEGHCSRKPVAAPVLRYDCWQTIENPCWCISSRYEQWTCTFA